MTVRRRARDGERRGGAARARHVLDDHRLPDRLGHHLADGTAGNIAETARTEPHDESYCPRRIFLCARGGGDAEKNEDRCDPARHLPSDHAHSPLWKLFRFRHCISHPPCCRYPRPLRKSSAMGSVKTKASCATTALLPLDVAYTPHRLARGVRAGHWVFATGQAGTDSTNGIAPEVIQ